MTETQCNICLEVAVGPVMTSCYHVFCEQCFKKAWGLKQECAVCRATSTFKGHIGATNQDLVWFTWLKDSTIATKEYKEASAIICAARAVQKPHHQRRHWLLKAAELGNRASQITISNEAWEKKDYVEAIKWLEAVPLDKMDVETLHNLCHAYYDIETTKDIAKVRMYAEEAIRRDDVSGYSNMGQLLIEEDGRIEEGVVMMKKACDRDDEWSIDYMGTYYYNAKCYAEARPYVERCNLPQSQYHLAKLYYHGLGNLDHSFEKAVELLKKNPSHSSSAELLARMYILGLGTNKNPKCALELITTHIHTPWAQYWMGHFCQHGNHFPQDFPQDIPKAMEYYAKSQSVPAQLALADLMVAQKENFDTAKSLYTQVLSSCSVYKVFALVGLNRIKEALDMEVDDHAQYAPMFAFKMAQVWKKHGKRRKGYLKQVKKYLTMSAKLGHDQAKGCLEMLFPKDVPPAFKRMCT
jgi:TPR repeat protein